MTLLDGTRSCQTQKVGRLRMGESVGEIIPTKRERDARQQDIFSETKSITPPPPPSLPRTRCDVTVCLPAWVTLPSHKHYPPPTTHNDKDRPKER